MYFFEPLLCTFYLRNTIVMKQQEKSSEEEGAAKIREATDAIARLWKS